MHKNVDDFTLMCVFFAKRGFVVHAHVETHTLKPAPHASPQVSYPKKQQAAEWMTAPLRTLGGLRRAPLVTHSGDFSFTQRPCLFPHKSSHYGSKAWSGHSGGIRAS